MRKTLVTFSAAVLLMLSAGCSDTPDAELTPTTPAATPAAISAEKSESLDKPSDDTNATVQQWASRVAQGQTGFLDAMDSWEDYGCLPSDEDVVCDSALRVIGITALTLAVEIESGTNEDADGFIGEPPVEIADLVSQTLSKAKDVATAAGASNQCDSDCVDENSDAIITARQLVATLNGWSPYM